MSISRDRAAQPRLSVAMIVRDEADVLAASLESVRAIADEIVVLDTGSTDRTPDIAQRCGAVVDRAAWGSDFSAARNRCLQRVTGDWILWLDAGEQLDGASAAYLRTFVDHQSDPANVYLLMIETPPDGDTVGAEQMAQPRLMPGHAGLRFTGRVRETLRPAIERAGLQVDTLPARIVRHVRQHDPGRRARIAYRNLELASLESSEFDCEPVRVSLALGDAYAEVHAQDAARAAYRRAADAAEKGSTEMLDAYYGLLSVYGTDTFLRDMQLSACLEALETYPFDAQLLLTMGNCLQAKHRVDLATRCFELAVTHGQVDLGTWHLTELAELAAHALSLALQTQGRDEEARRVLEESLGCHHGSSRLRRRLIDLHVKHGRSDEAIAVSDWFAIAADEREPLRDAIRGACRAAQGDWTPALGYLQSAYVEGCRDPICLRWLSVTLLSNGQIEPARPVLREWRQMEPANAELQAYLAAVEGTSGPADGKGLAEQAASDSAARQFRIDPGTTVLEAAPPILPIISQATSADCAFPAENRQQ